MPDRRCGPGPCRRAGRMTGAGLRTPPRSRRPRAGSRPTYAAPEVWNLAKEFRERAGWGAILGRVFELVPKIAELCKGVALYIHWLNVEAHNLEDCALVIGSTGRCWTVISAVIVNILIKKLTVPYFV